MMMLVHEVFATILLYTCFCRAVKMDVSTALAIRLAFWGLGMAATVSIFAPIVWGWTPDSVSLALLISITTLQTVTSTYWRNEIPPQFKVAK